jgi:hypothetical protein
MKVPPMPAPPDYVALSVSERQQLSDLLEKAAGVRPRRLPEAGALDDTPAGFISDLAAFVSPHMARMRDLPRGATYDPRPRSHKT